MEAAAAAAGVEVAQARAGEGAKQTGGGAGEMRRLRAGKTARAGGAGDGPPFGRTVSVGGAAAGATSSRIAETGHSRDWPAHAWRAPNGATTERPAGCSSSLARSLIDQRHWHIIIIVSQPRMSGLLGEQKRVQMASLPPLLMGRRRSRARRMARSRALAVATAKEQAPSRDELGGAHPRTREPPQRCAVERAAR